MKKQRIYLAALAAFALAGFLAGPLQISRTSIRRQPRAIQATDRGKPWINLKEGQDIPTTYVGQGQLQDRMQSGMVDPTALASADFDEDGMPDLVCAYSSADGGLITLHRGNEESLYPQKWRGEREVSSARPSLAFPFKPETSIYALQAAPDFLGAGDFDNDGHRDVVAASRGGNSLQFLRGNGHGEFAPVQLVPLPGSITAMTVGEMNRADGLADLIVGVTSASGSEVLVFEDPRGAFKEKPEVFAVRAPATSLALGHLDESYENDLAIAAGREVLIVHGRDRRQTDAESLRGEIPDATIERYGFDFNVTALEVGDFIWDRDARPELALLAQDGAVHFLARGDLDRRPWTSAEMEADQTGSPANKTGQKRAATAQAKLKLRRVGWSEVVATPAVSGSTQSTLTNRQSPVVMVRTRTGSLPVDTLVIASGVENQLSIVAEHDLDPLEAGASTLSAKPRVEFLSKLDTDTATMAVLPMRLNTDSLSDLVILRKGSTTPTMMITAPTVAFTVNKTDDHNDGTCDAGDCTLREAIIASNATAGTNTIGFNIGAGTPSITLTSSLPIAGNGLSSVTIDGDDGPSTKVEINGNNVGGLDAVSLSGDSTARNLVINRSRNALRTGSIGINTVEGCYIGTNAAGTAASANSGIGISVSFKNATIGGTAAAAANVVSGNGSHGVQVFNDDNKVLGNIIGMDKTGSTVIGNGGTGVRIEAGLRNIVGGTAAGSRNIITGNGSHGVDLRNATGNSLVQGNYIGASASGGLFFGNGGLGVSVIESASNTIGAMTATPGTAGGNLIMKNVLGGINFGGATNNLTILNKVLGNIIGLSGSDGIQINSPPDIHFPAGQITIQGNYIGVDSTGTLPLQNNGAGIIAQQCDSITIGGATSDLRNVISGNAGNGITFQDSSNISIQSNYIGVDKNATGAIPNGGSGVSAQGPSNLFIGGASSGGNIISGNTVDGITLINSIFVNGSVSILGNFIGVNSTASAALGNKAGIRVDSKNNVQIGDPSSAPNIISGNREDGIVFSNCGDFTDTVKDNYIGVAGNGASPLGNGRAGVILFNASVTVQMNIIANNGREGITSPTTGGHSPYFANSIYANGLAGIVNPVTLPDDACDGDQGPNDGQNSPVLASVTPSTPTTVMITGALNSAANRTYRIEFFSNTDCDGTDRGEGQVFVGSTDVTTDNNCNASFSLLMPYNAARNVYTATATDVLLHETSIFSLCQFLNVPQTGPTFRVNTDDDHNDGQCTFPDCSLREAINAANAHPNSVGPDSIVFHLVGIEPVRQIMVTSPLPAITDPVVLDGLTQSVPGSEPDCNVFLTLALVASNAGPGANGLQLNPGASGSTIRGLVIERFAGDGILLQGSSNNVIECNFIGTDPSGLTDQGNGGRGIELANGSNNNIIGGNGRNIVSGNDGGGIAINLSSGNRVTNNFIGLQRNGLFGNGNIGYGILIDLAGANNNIIGGGPGLGNTIAFNSGKGIQLGFATNAGTGNSILGNSIYSNGSLGIDLNNDGVTANDAGDSDTGSNSLQNFPLLNSVSIAAGMATVNGTLNSTPLRMFRIELFANDDCDPSGNGEGKTVLTSVNVTTDVNGNAPFLATAPTPAILAFTATATDQTTNDTSEFSPCLSCSLTCPANVTVNNTLNQCGAVVSYAGAQGSCGTITCNPASGSFFPKGTTTVTCTSTVGSNCSFTVTVNDTQLPVVNCAAVAGQSANVDASCSAVVPDVRALVRAQSSDNCSVQANLTVTQSPIQGGSVSGAGSHPITVMVKDESNNSATCIVAFTINDITPPTITCGANIVQGTAPNLCAATVSYKTPQASDNCSGVGAVLCSPASGSTFPKGATTVTCTVKDAANNMAACSFTVTVNDTQAPQITCLANIVKGTDPNACSAVVTFNPTATDNCPGVAAPICAPASGTSFPKGTTTVTCTVRDAANNQSTACSFTVTVNDTQSPSIACPANITTKTPQTGGSCVPVTYPAPVVTDNCGVAGTVCTPPSGSCFPLGTTTVTCTATDTAGNIGTCTFKVTVFDLCVQDDGNPGTVVLINSVTGDYRFCCNGVTYIGKGTMTIRGGSLTLEHNPADRRVLVRVDDVAHKGSGSIQAPPGTSRCTITDRNTQDNNCACQ